jgi:hypothetical protein
MGYPKKRRRCGPKPNRFPADDDPHRCTAMNRRKFQRCHRWAMLGKKVCRSHGGRRQKMIRMSRVPMLYSKYLGKTLREKMEGLLCAPSHEQVSLYEELALARTGLIDCIVMYEACNGEKAAEIDQQTRRLATACMMEAVDRVKELVLAVSNVEKAREDKVSVTVVDLFLSQVIRAIYDCLKTEPNGNEMAIIIEKSIRDNVRLPEVRGGTIAQVGTGSTPDQIVAAMDALSASEGVEQLNEALAGIPTQQQ